MKRSSENLSHLQRGILQKCFGLAAYFVCIFAIAFIVDWLSKRAFTNYFISAQKSGKLSSDILPVLCSLIQDKPVESSFVIIFFCVILALTTFFVIRWAGNRNWSTIVELPHVIEFRSAMDKLGIQKPSDRFEIIQKYSIPLYIADNPLFETESMNVRARYYAYASKPDMRSLGMLEKLIGSQQLCLAAEDFSTLSEEYKKAVSAVTSTALVSLKDQNDKLKAALSLKEHEVLELTKTVARLREENTVLLNKAKTADARDGKADKRERDRMIFWRVAGPLVNRLLASPESSFTRPQIQQAFEKELEHHPELKADIKALLHTPKKEQDSTPYSLEGWGMTLIREALGEKAKSTPGAAQKR